ncbi:VOC family protein [Candidatus Soleaferrea massiliensis]|uniref:VOC family protein n=1 Tax=Candidatus Soleaferrea massiliensis TaxID=1470354 RepID=UPI00058FB080|nr:VOC family protein [Candidatus Soleaferrea massiliensis]
MQFKMIHNNLNVFDLKKSLAFYEEAFGLKEHHRIDAPDGSFIIVYLCDELGQHLLELTWLRDRKEKYNLGDNEFHLAFETADYAAAFQKHSEMGVVCFENTAMGIYFVSDPDGYWLEVLPANR